MTRSAAAAEEHKFSIESQPGLEANSALVLDAVVSWQYRNGRPTILSRFRDDVWEGPKAGALFAATPASRRIDFKVLGDPWRGFAKLALYAAIRHPYRINKPPTFATLTKKSQAVFRYFRYLAEVGVPRPEEATLEINKAFLRQVTAAAEHIETVVGQVAFLQEINVQAAQGLLKFSLQLPPYKNGASVVARRLWIDVHGKAFDEEGGHQPFSDADAEVIVRSALFYVETLSAAILEATEACNEIALEYPKRRYDRSQESLCYRAQKKALAKIDWPAPDAGYFNWPPRNARQVRTHLRMTEAACAIVILFALGNRRSELLELTTDCMVRDGDAWSIRIVYRKGEDDLERGRPVTLPACEEVRRAAEVQCAIARLVAVNVHGFNAGMPVHESLFVQVRDRHFLDADKKGAYASEAERRQLLADAAASLEEGDELPREGGPLTLTALNSVLRDFKEYVTPAVEGRIAPHRFRKTVGRLITLTMEGAPLILQLIFGHDHYRTTLRYMLASPFIQDEIVEQFPNLIARNLANIYRSRDELGGEGGRAIAAAMSNFRSDASPVQTVNDLDLSEEEFVALGLEMVESGYMMLSVLGRGLYCFKPVNAVGSCANGGDETIPNPGRCTPKCQHNVQTRDRKLSVERTLIWLASKLESPSLSAPLQKFYSSELERQRAAFASTGQ